jgi:tetratricopeptide (TPR) repeat protein
MRYCFYSILFFTFFCPHLTFSQFSKKIDSLSSVCLTTARGEEKVRACGQLAELYYVYQLDVKGDSVLQQQVKTAELTGNKELILEALFGNAITNLTNWRSSASFDNALRFLQKGRDYAKAISSEDYLTLAHTRIAALYRKRGQTDNAFYNANIAFTTSLGIDNDSVKIIAAIELGNAYHAKGEEVLAFKTYTNALEKAEHINNIPLQSAALHRFADLYYALNNKEESRDYLFKSYELNKKNNYVEGLVRDNIDLARFTDEKSYIIDALHLADSLRLERYTLQAKRVMYGYYAVIIANSDSTLNYINSNEDLKFFFQNRGTASYYFTLGSIFKLANKPDSAIHYFQLAEPGLDSSFDVSTRQSVYVSLGESFKTQGKYAEAISYYEKAYANVASLQDPAAEARYCEALSDLYEITGDYKRSVFFLRNAGLLNDSLQGLASQREIALAEVNNEKKNHEKELEKIEGQKLTKRNLQYMAITIVITFLFIVMLVMGMFPLSKLTVKLCGYMVFISLFEFIVLLIDSWLHRIAHGEPLKIWLMKIILIALLVPLQHFLERRMIRFLESRRLHKLKEKISLKKWRRRKKIDEDTIDEIENDTAVL